MRTLLVLLTALRSPRVPPTTSLDCPFRVLPWDVGISTFKSDKYLAVVEAAQLDYVVHTGLLPAALKRRVRWVNVTLATRFLRALHLFDRYVVSTRVECIDDKHAYFSHRFTSAQGLHAEVLVKVKFKEGRLTVPPESLLGAVSRDKSAAVRAINALQE